MKTFLLLATFLISPAWAGEIRDAKLDPKKEIVLRISIYEPTTVRLPWPIQSIANGFAADAEQIGNGVSPTEGPWFASSYRPGQRHWTIRALPAGRLRTTTFNVIGGPDSRPYLFRVEHVEKGNDSIVDCAGGLHPVAPGMTQNSSPQQRPRQLAQALNQVEAASIIVNSPVVSDRARTPSGIETHRPDPQRTKATLRNSEGIDYHIATIYKVATPPSVVAELTVANSGKKKHSLDPSSFAMQIGDRRYPASQVRSPASLEPSEQRRILLLLAANDYPELEALDLSANTYAAHLALLKEAVTPSLPLGPTPSGLLPLPNK